MVLSSCCHHVNSPFAEGRLPLSLLQFKWIAGTAIATGCCFVLVFLIGVKEPRLSHHKQGSEECNSRQSFKVWFGKLLYYQVAAVYMLTRLTTNVSQVSVTCWPHMSVHLFKTKEASLVVLGVSFTGGVNVP
jgi:hypothetical protein